MREERDEPSFSQLLGGSLLDVAVEAVELLRADHFHEAVAKQHQRDRRRDVHLGADRSDGGDEIDHPADFGFGLGVSFTAGNQSEVFLKLLLGGWLKTVRRFTGLRTAARGA